MSKFRAGLLGFFFTTLAYAAVFNQFGPATGILKGSASSPITTAATSSDVVALFDSGSCGTDYLRGNGTCDTPSGPSGAALTKSDDTNVTLTLGGSPTTALLSATSLTLGWSGTLAASRGGLGMSTVTDDTVAVANGTTWQSKALADCDAATSAVTYDTTTNAWGCNTINGATGANPAASVGLSAVNGSAGTFMRSDGAPAISQTIVPTWSGKHTFSGGVAFTARDFYTGTGSSGVALCESGGWYGVVGFNLACTSSQDVYNYKASDVAGLIDFHNTGVGNGFAFKYATSGTAGNPITFTSAGTIATGGWLVGSPTGGAQGSGTINATGVYVNGVSVQGGAVTSGTFTATLTDMTGTVNCSMKWRLTGSRVDLFLNSGSACTGTSNTTAMTMTGLPAAIQPSATTWLPCLGVDSGATAFSSCFIDTSSSASTIRFDRTNNTGTVTNFSATAWTNSGTKGIPVGWDVTYDLRN